MPLVRKPLEQLAPSSVEALYLVYLAIAAVTKPKDVQSLNEVKMPQQKLASYFASYSFCLTLVFKTRKKTETLSLEKMLDMSVSGLEAVPVLQSSLPGLFPERLRNIRFPRSPRDYDKKNDNSTSFEKRTNCETLEADMT